MPKTPTTFEDLLEEAHFNAKQDRKRLVTRLEMLDSGGDPEVAATIAEHIIEATETLTKINGQLVEMAKLRLKKEGAGDDQEFDGDDIDGMYSEVENDDDLEN